MTKPIYRGPRKYPPLGAGYKALWDFDRYQPRYQCGRYTMPDPQTTSLRSLQNPLERHIPIPCIRDQYTLSTDHGNYSYSARTDNQRAYEQQATNHLNRLTKHSEHGPWQLHKIHYDIKDLASESKTITKTNNHLPAAHPPANTVVRENSLPNQLKSIGPSTPHSHQSTDSLSNKKRSVSWADNHISSINVNANNNDNEDSYTNHLRMSTYNNNPSTTLRYCRGDKLRSMKAGRHYHYLNHNSQLCDTDIPTGYDKLEDDISYQIIADGTTPCSR